VVLFLRTRTRDRGVRILVCLGSGSRTFGYKILKSQGAALSQEIVSESSKIAADGLVSSRPPTRSREERVTPVPGDGDKDFNADVGVNVVDGQFAAESVPPPGSPPPVP
jgi:hypothetical protein